MSWFRIDDGFHCHPKVLAAGNAAAGLFARFGSYSSDQGTNGFIPRQLARVYGTAREVQALLECRLIEHHPDGYLITDFLDYNPTAEEVRAERAVKHETKVAAGRLGGIASGVARRKHSGTNAEANGEATSSANSKQNEAPSPPFPLLPLHPQDEFTRGAPRPVDISGWAERRRVP